MLKHVEKNQFKNWTRENMTQLLTTEKMKCLKRKKSVALIPYVWLSNRYYLRVTVMI